FFGLPMPLLAIHILWINLITDGLPGLALASESNEPNIMNRTPRDPNESIFSRGLGFHIVWVGFLICIITLGIQSWALHKHFENCQTMAFSVLCFSQLGHVMAIRSTQDSVFTIGLCSNKSLTLSLILTITLQLLIIYVPWCNDIFKTQPLSVFELGITLCVSSLTFWAVEIEKWILRRNMDTRQSFVSIISIH
ncbi:MAG: cation transporting ATPase C-terminal domain-containing protein, partial [Ignavibacteria bacterium]